MRTNKRLLALLVATMVAGSVVGGTTNAFDTDTIKAKYEAFKEKLKERYEKAKESVNAHLENNEKIQSFKENLEDRLKKFKDGLSSAPKTLKQQMEELREEYYNTQDPEKKKEIADKLKLIKQKYDKVINKFKEEAKEKMEIAKEKAAALKQKIQDKYLEHKQDVYQARNNMENIAIDSVTLSTELKQKIDNILEKRLFNRIVNLPLLKQEEVYKKVLYRLNKGLDATEREFKRATDPVIKKRIAYKYAILKYLKEKIDDKYREFIEDNQDVLYDSLLNDYIWE